MDSTNRNHLSGVQEEPTRDSLEDHYFRESACSYGMIPGPMARTLH